MTSLVIGSVLVPMCDQAIKAAVRRRVGHGSVRLGSLGEVRVMQSRIWLARSHHGLSVPLMWFLWILAAAGLGLASHVVPSSAWLAGLVLGGSLSHACETAVRGSVCDYICLRFWPAFNLADAALTIGAIGLTLEFALAIAAMWS